MRKLPALPIALLLIVSTGCTATRLRDRLVTQSDALTELQYKQVLGNLARLHADPYAVPAHVVLHDGTAQIQDNGAANFTLFRSSVLPPTVSGSRTVVEQWTVHPVTDDMELKLLRLAYQRALGMPISLTTEAGLANDLAHELKKQIAWPEQLSFLEYNLEQGILGGIAGMQATQGQQLVPSINPGLRSGGASAGAPPSGIGPTSPPPSETPPPNSPSPFQPPTTPRPPGARLMPGFRPDRRGEADVHLARTGSDVEPGEPAPAVPWTTSYDQQVSQQAVLATHTAKLRDRELVRSWLTTVNDDIITEGDLQKGLWALDPDDPGNPSVIVSASAREVRRQVKDVEGDIMKIPAGWVCFGRKPPHDACYVGRYKDHYAWVVAEGRRPLADFTLLVMNLADLIKDASVTTSPGGVRFSPTPAR